VAIAIDQTQLAHRLLRTQHATITTLATFAEYRDVDTGEHVARVARGATEIAAALAGRGGMPEIDDDFIEQIGLASILHDVGKIAIPDAILMKPGALDTTERRAMEEHVTLGQDILLRAARRSENGELLKVAAEIALHHHERYDGTGYPAGLKSQEIPLAARIVALVDVFDALTSLRPYKQAWPVEKALDFIRAQSGSHFDPRVVEAFLGLEAQRRNAVFIEWNESMSVGHPDLDFDHRRLIGIINRLWVASGHGHRRVIEFILDDLVNYTEFHFKREEELMAEAGYADVERHRRVHAGFCRRIEEIRWEYFQGIRDQARDEIFRFLTTWLNRHILDEDMRYKPCFSRDIAAAGNTGEATLVVAPG
ncbi:MAG: bacteriohemerythrin, partial [Betaproteobacteria bacterium]